MPSLKFGFYAKYDSIVETDLSLVSSFKLEKASLSQH